MPQKKHTDPLDLFICSVTFLPLRSSPSHRSEMVSQVLFGERFKILVSSGIWIKISMEFDSYEGWIDSSQGGYARFRENNDGIITGCELKCAEKDGGSMYVAPGSELFNLSKNFASFSIADKTYLLPKESASLFSPASSVIATAHQFLNAPYLWGGRTPWGIDCSGLIQIVFKIHGIALPRDASQQAAQGHIINFMSDSKPGDVLFFSGESDTISHTGLLYSDGTVIHASGTVRTDKVDHQGIWNDDVNKYTHRLRVIRRMIQ